MKKKSIKKKPVRHPTGKSKSTDVPGMRCPVCELVLLKPEPIGHWEYIDSPHADLKECMIIMIGDLRRAVSRLEDRISSMEKLSVSEPADANPRRAMFYSLGRTPRPRY